jgi:hypothetical protein
VTAIVVGDLTFTFPDAWDVALVDEWAFYRKQFVRVLEGIKSADLAAVEPRRTTWLIEVKDYRRHRRTKGLDLVDEVVKKTFDSLACILSAAFNANADAERALAARAISSERLRVVLHLEQPAKTSRLLPRAFDPKSVEQKLRIRLKPIDPHALVVATGAMRNLPWSVT